MTNVQPINGKKTSDLKQESILPGCIRKKSFLIISLCVAFLFWQYSKMKSTSLRFLDREGTEHVLSLPVRDKKRLFYFMHKLFAEDSFAYTLLDSKPVSWACYKKSFPVVDFSFFCDSLKSYNRTLRLGWKTWLKYCHLFSSTSFWAENSEDSGWCSILLVNPQQFNTVVNEHKQDFQDVLQREILDGFQLLQEAKTCSLMHEVLQGHQALLGIVLGYGRDNSWEFLKRSKKRDPLSWVWEENEYNPEEITNITGSGIESNLLLYSCPSFAGNPHSEESIKLKKEYLQTRQKVLNYYKGKDFLEATLSLLAGFRP